MSFSMTDTAKNRNVLYFVVFVKAMWDLLFLPPRFWLFLRSAQMFRKWIPAPAPVWHWPRPALLHPQLLLYLADQLSCDTIPSPLCSSTHNYPPRISVPPFEFLELKEKQHRAQYCSGKSVYNRQVPRAPLFRSILWINEHSFAGLQEASAPQHPSCRINKWTVDFSGVSVSYF